MELQVAYPEIVDTLKSLLINSGLHNESHINKCDRCIDSYSINELVISQQVLANFTDAINEEYCLKLSKKDLHAIRTVRALAKTIQGLI